MSAVDLEIAGQTIQLLPGYAAFWKDQKTLLIADLHLGRSGVFHSQSLALPEGADAADLARLSALIQQSGAERLFILGDLFHARAGMTEETRAGLDAWLSAQSISVGLVEGNHDRRSRPYGLSESIDVFEEDLIEAPFRFAHEPSKADGLYTMAGHLHPGMRLRDAAGCSHRTKAFWRTEHFLVLPAFGALTSFASVPPEQEGVFYPCSLEAVYSLPRTDLTSKLRSSGN